MRRLGFATLVPLVLLSLPVTAAAKPGALNLSLAPQDAVKVGDRYCVEGNVTDERGQPVSRALVQLDARKKRASKRGTFAFCQKLHYAGFHTAFAFKGDDRGHRRIRLGSGAPQGAGDWRPVQIFFRVDADKGNCSKSGFGPFATVDTFGVDRGNCNDIADGGKSGPYSGVHTQIDWEEAGGSRVRLNIYTRKGTLVQMAGYMPSRGSDQLVINESRGWTPNAITGGSDVARTGDPGGPLKVRVEEQTSDVRFGRRVGYLFDIQGYVLEK